MAKPLDPKKIESARQFSNRAERREQRRKLMQDEIAENQRSNGVIVIPPKKLQEEIEERDRNDSSREHSPLRRAPDAVFVDTSDMAIEQVIAFIKQKMQEKV